MGEQILLVWLFKKGVVAEYCCPAVLPRSTIVTKYTGSDQYWRSTFTLRSPPFQLSKNSTLLSRG